jgi:cohesin loading factor subunit SCC2
LICENQDSSVDAKTWGDVVHCKENSAVNLDEISWGNFTMACFQLFLFYLQKADCGTKCKALSALRGIFVANPQLLLQMDHVGLFQGVMDDAAGTPLQLEALECWKNILINEERRIDSGTADAKMAADGTVTTSKKIAGDQDGDATLFGGVLTSHSKRLFEMIHSASPTIRLSTLELLCLMLRQGLVNPNEAVPHLFALQCDVQNENIRSLALRLLVTEGEKRPDTLRQLIRSGVKQAYAFQRALNPHEAGVFAVVQNKKGEISSIFDKVFPSVATNRKQRLSLYRSLLGLFDQEDESVHRLNRKAGKEKVSSKDLSLLSFAAQILAHLPYNTTGDPLFIVHTISNQVTLQGLQILDKLASMLRPYGLASSDNLEETNAGEDALEVAARCKFPSRTHHALPLSSEDFDVAGFADLCRDGAALSMLLRLKSFLCSSYNLSAIRVLEYDPNAKERLCEKGIAKPKFTTPFNGSLEEVTTNGIVHKDALIRVYAEFRQMMREENKFADVAIPSPKDCGQPTASKRPRTGDSNNDEVAEDD